MKWFLNKKVGYFFAAAEGAGFLSTKAIAFEGQFFTQVPHPTHFFVITWYIGLFFSPVLTIALNGHFLIQIAFLLHFVWSITAITLRFGTIFSAANEGSAANPAAIPAAEASLRKSRRAH
jgi:hypothetical protein